MCRKILGTGEGKYGSILGGLEGCPQRPTGVPITLLRTLQKKTNAECIVIYLGTLSALTVLLIGWNITCNTCTLINCFCSCCLSSNHHWNLPSINSNAMQVMVLLYSREVQQQSTHCSGYSLHEARVVG